MGVREETARFRVANRDHVGSGGLSPRKSKSEARERYYCLVYSNTRYK